ncbi:hypothetical protein B0H14DRAFT_2370795 [Mycena olivaceomarginata]|nr:hypothetical protein B0H14DRAFT_2370795 [Mycena olivaceomarginata]
MNPSGIGRKNCGCVLCYRDRTQLDCENHGVCIETAKNDGNIILPKWNPMTTNPDLSEDLELTDEEREGNNLPIEADRIFVFDPTLTLSEMAKGYRIFAVEESLNEVPARRYKIPGQKPNLTNSIFTCASASARAI